MANTGIWDNKIVSEYEIYVLYMCIDPLTSIGVKDRHTRIRSIFFILIGQLGNTKVDGAWKLNPAKADREKGLGIWLRASRVQFYANPLVVFGYKTVSRIPTIIGVVAIKRKI